MDDERPLRQWLTGKDTDDFLAHQKIYITELVGKIDPLSWEEYLDYDGYKGLRTFFSQGFDSFLQKVVASGFREINRLLTETLGPQWCEIRVEKAAHSAGERRLAHAAARPHPIFDPKGCPTRSWRASSWPAKPLKPRRW